MNGVVVVQGSWRSVSGGVLHNCSLCMEMKSKRFLNPLYVTGWGNLLTFLAIALIDEVW